MKIPFVDLITQTQQIADEVNKAISQVVSNCDFILGDEVGKFENAFAKYIGTDFAIGVASGLDALRLSLLALGIKAGDEVIIPANTFIATALAVSSIGAQPVLIDCDLGTYNVDVSKIEDSLTSRTRAVIPVHLTGQPAQMDVVNEMALKHDLLVVEDACQAHGAEFGNRKCGGLGHAGCFSFYPGKNLGAFGDGGMITTNDEELCDRIRQLRNYGQQKKYEHRELGFNSRLDTIQAAVLNVKLPFLSHWNTLRSRHANRYRSLLGEDERIQLQRIIPNATHVYHLFIIETDKRDGLQNHLANHGIQTGVHYPTPIHHQPAYQKLSHSSFPNAERLAKRTLSLPMYPELADEQIDFVANSILDWLD